MYPSVPLIVSKKIQLNPFNSLLLNPLLVSFQSLTSTILDSRVFGRCFMAVQDKNRRALGSKWDVHVFPTSTHSFPKLALDIIGQSHLGHLMWFTQCNFTDANTRTRPTLKAGIVIKQRIETSSLLISPILARV